VKQLQNGALVPCFKCNDLSLALLPMATFGPAGVFKLKCAHFVYKRQFIVLLTVNSNGSKFTIRYSQLREPTPHFPPGLDSSTPAGNIENPRIIHCPPKKSALVFSLFLQKCSDGELLLFFLQLLEHYAVWLEDPFDLPNYFKAPICGRAGVAQSV